ncbi:MAG: hypothetical protein ACE14P_01560 [Methanotrichaceae archaeon]
MDFESKVTGFATGLFLLGSYIMLFYYWEYSAFIVAVAAILLLLVAFRDHALGKSDLVAFSLAIPISLFFMKGLVNNTYIPLIVVLIFSLIAINAKVEAFLPTLAGVLVLQFADTRILLNGLYAVLRDISPLFGIRYEINNAGYLLLYHTRTKLPILLDDVKLLLPFFVALLVAELLLLAIIEDDRKNILKSAFPVAAVPFVFTILSLQNFLYNPSPANFIPDNLSALALPLASILLAGLVIPGAKIKRFQAGSFNSKKVTAPLLIIFLLLGLLYYTPITSRSDPKIIIDEAHSEWEPTWPDYIKTYEKDPVSGTNNYFGWLNILASLYDINLIIDRPDKVPAVTAVGTTLVDEISLKTLESISNGRKAVLILKCVTKPYTNSEVNAILDFISKGNGLLLISEHTDIYGQCTNLNPIAERLGYRFLPTGVQDIYTDSTGSTTQKGELPPIISRYMTGDQSWETSDSIEKLNGSSLFEVTTRPSYFGHFRNETAPFFLSREFPDEVKMNSLFDRHLVIAGTKYGDGKVLMFTDSTDFNNGVIGFGDHAQLSIGMIEYVSSIDRLNNMLVLILLLAVAAAIVIINRRSPMSALIVLSILLLISLNLSYPLAHYTAEFPGLKGKPVIAILSADADYKEDYLSGMFDLEKLMDKYFKQNTTALIISNPPENWIKISCRIDNLHDAIVDKGDTSGKTFT